MTVRLLLVLSLTGAALAQTGASVDVRISTVSPGPTVATLSLWPTHPWLTVSIGSPIRFDELPSGAYRIEISADGCAEFDSSFALYCGQHLTLAVLLSPMAFTLPEIVVHSERSSRTQYEFHRSDIARSPARTLPEFLSMAAGLDVRAEGDGLSSQSARIGGSNGDQVLVLLDGRRIGSVGTGEADLSAIPLDWVESIAVYRGSQSALGGEAIGGVVEIATRSPATVEDIEVSTSVAETYHRASLLCASPARPLAASVFFERTQGPGDFRYRISEDDGNGPNTVGLGEIHRRVNADVTRDQLLAKVAWPDLDAFGLEASGVLDRCSRGMPGYLAPYLTPHARQENREEALSVRPTWRGGGVLLDGRASVTRQWRRYTDPDSPTLVSGTQERGERWETELQGGGQWGRHSLRGGGQLAQERLAGDQVEVGEAVRQRWAAWSKLTSCILTDTSSALSVAIEPGARFESFGDDHEFVPRLESSAAVGRKARAGLTVAWGRSYKAPSLYSLFWLDDQMARGNPELRPEHSNETVGRLFVEHRGIDVSRLDVSASQQEVTDLICWRQGFDNRWKPLNLKRVRISTLEAAAEQSLWRSRVRLTAGANWTEARDATGERNTNGKYLTFRAPRTFRGSISYSDRGVSLAAAYCWVAARPALESNSKWLRSYDVLDLKAAWRFSYGRTGIEPAIGLNNALEESYRVVRFAPMPLRQWYATVRVSRL